MKSLNKKENRFSFFRKLSMPHAFTMLFGILVIVGILSLILWSSGTSFEQVVKKDDKLELETVTVVGAGILDWISSIYQGFTDAFGVIIFLFVLGAFINVVIKSQALDAMIGKLSTKFKKEVNFATQKQYKDSYFKAVCHNIAEVFRQTWIIMVLIVFFSFAGSTYGMAEESIAFYAIIIPLALVAGFDVWTGFLIVFVGAGVGVMASTVNPFSVLTAISSGQDGLVTEEAKKSIEANGLVWRWIAWAVFTLFTIVFVCWYALRTKMNPDKSKLKDMFAMHSKMFGSKSGTETPQLTKKHLATIIIFVLTFLFMVTAMLQWDNLLGNKNTAQLEQITEKNNPEAFAAGKVAPFDGQAGTIWLHNSNFSRKVLGWNIFHFGEWFFEALVAYFFILTLVIGFINWRGEKNFINDFVDGAKDMLGVCFAIGIAKSIGALLKGTNMSGFVVQGLASPIKELSANSSANIVIPLISYIVFIPLTFLIPSTSGLATAAFPIWAPAVEKVGTATTAAPLSGAVTAYAWAAGWANLFVPTYGVVIGALAVTKIPYGRFVKEIASYLGILFLLGLAMLIFGGAIGWL